MKPVDEPRYYKKKPVVIAAMLFDGKNGEKVVHWINSQAVDRTASYDGQKVIIKTLEGDMATDVGDYVIKGVQGEFYPCKPDIFEQTYERAY